jgi:hypothetical protein
LALASDILLQRFRLVSDCVTSSGTSMEPAWEYMATTVRLNGCLVYLNTM